MTIITINGIALSEILIRLWESLPFELLAFLILIVFIISILQNSINNRTSRLNISNKEIEIKCPYLTLIIIGFITVLFSFWMTGDVDNFKAGAFGLMMLTIPSIMFDYIGYFKRKTESNEETN